MKVPLKITRENAQAWLQLSIRELSRWLKWSLRLQPHVQERAAHYVRCHARPNDPESVLKHLDQFAWTQQRLGNVGDERGVILDDVVERVQATHVLELGGLVGYSAIRMGRLLQPRGGHLISIERNPRNAATAREIIAHAGLDRTVSILIGKTSELIPLLLGPFDVIFLDHTKRLYLSDLHQLEAHNLLHAGTHVVADNAGIFEPTLEGYLSYVRNSPNYVSTYYHSRIEYGDDIEDGVEVSVWRPQDNGHLLREYPS